MVVGLGSSAAIAACAEDKKKSAPKPAEPAKKAAPASKPAAPSGEMDKPKAASGEKAAIKLQVGDQLSYSTKLIEVKAGTTVELTLVHGGKLQKAVMGHNFVLLKPGTDMGAFATAAMAANGSDYIPAAMKDKIIAHTKLIGGGESDTISFPAPAPGEYQYLCTFPGHYAAMNGKFVVA